MPHMWRCVEFLTARAYLKPMQSAKGTTLHTHSIGLSMFKFNFALGFEPDAYHCSEPFCLLDSVLQVYGPYRQAN